MQVVTVLIYLLAAPFVGGLLAGFDRKITARMQGRKGPPLLQPFYDLFKLFSKQAVVVNHVQHFLIYGYLLFIIFTGCLFFFGGDMLLVFFALTLAEMFLIMAACSANSPYSAMGAQRELVQMMAYEPMLLLVAIGFYLSTRTFAVGQIIRSSAPSIEKLPGMFIGFVFILAIKFRKSPFDISTSHHAHQEMVKGLTTELSGNILALVELSHWYESVFLLGVTALFFIDTNPWSYLIAIVACILVYFLELLIDNVFPRVKWNVMLKSTWLTILVAGVINFMILILM